MYLGMENTVMLHQFGNDIHHFMKYLVHGANGPFLQEQGTANCWVSLELFPGTGFGGDGFWFGQGVDIEVGRNEAQNLFPMPNCLHDRKCRLHSVTTGINLRHRQTLIRQVVLQKRTAGQIGAAPLGVEMLTLHIG